VLLGSKIVDNMRIIFEMEPAKGMWMLMGGEWKWMGTMGKPYHFEVKLEDPYSETRISYSDVTLTLTKVTDGESQSFDLHPMWGGSGLHYARNGDVMGDGQYVATVVATPPEFMRGETNKHLWMDPISVDFRFQIRDGEILSGSVVTETYVDPLPEGHHKDFHVVVGDDVFDDMGVKVEFEDAPQMYMPNGMPMPAPGPDDIHLEVKLTDLLKSDTRIPYSDVSITLDNGVDSPVTHHLHAMWGGSGLHYGVNAVVAPGTYDVTVDIGVPAFARSADDEFLYRPLPISATFSGYVHP
jgi:uncharacterized protein involved in high-affinity Fe2+ transport